MYIHIYDFFPPTSIKPYALLYPGPHPSPRATSCDVVVIPAVCVLFQESAVPRNFDMHFDKFHVFGQHLVNIQHCLVNVCPAGARPGLNVTQKSSY